MKRMLLIHDLCSVGKAAMMNMIPVLSVMGIEVCPLPTMLLSTIPEVSGNRRSSRCRETI